MLSLLAFSSPESRVPSPGYTESRVPGPDTNRLGI